MRDNNVHHAVLGCTLTLICGLTARAAVAADDAPTAPAGASTTASAPAKLSDAEVKKQLFDITYRECYKLPANLATRAFEQASAPLMAELQAVIDQAADPNSIQVYRAKLQVAQNRVYCLDDNGALKLSKLLRDQNGSPFLQVETYYFDANVYVQLGSGAALDQLVTTVKALGAPPQVMQYFTERADDEHALPNGKPMPDFDLTDLDGAHHHLADYKGKCVVIMLSSTDNDIGEREVPRLLALYQTYHSQGVEFLTVCRDRDRGSLDAYVADHKIPWPVVLRSDWDKDQFGTAFHTMMSPDDFLIGKDGVLIAKYLSEDRLEDKIKQALAGTLSAAGSTPKPDGGF